MVRIGIISEFNLHGTNYGNRLQALALYTYLTKHVKDSQIEYLYFDFYDKFVITKPQSVSDKFLLAKNYLFRRFRNSKNKALLTNRLNACNAFSQKYMSLAEEAWTWEKLINSSFDAIIVGSDVVWSQGRNKVGRIRFLDFDTKKTYRKISYAASFGKEWIPEENEKYVINCLEKFDAISVRELSTVSFLKNYNIKSFHVVDPTLLLSRNEWEALESMPSGTKYSLTEIKYIFCYLLDPDYKVLRYIEKWTERHNFFVVYIPHASGERDGFNLNSNRWIELNSCAPDEWIWLISHAEYIFTNSFHGTVFSTIFNKRFIVVKRTGQININNRMIDYLSCIGQTDKFIDINDIEKVKNLKWPYDIINPILLNKIELSKQFLLSQLIFK